MYSGYTLRFFVDSRLGLLTAEDPPALGEAQMPGRALDQICNTDKTSFLDTLALSLYSNRDIDRGFLCPSLEIRTDSPECRRISSS